MTQIPMKMNGWKAKFIEQFVTKEMLVTIGGLLLAAFVIWIFAERQANILESQFDAINGSIQRFVAIQEEQNTINREFTKALEANTQVLNSISYLVAAKR